MITAQSQVANSAKILYDRTVCNFIKYPKGD